MKLPFKKISDDIVVQLIESRDEFRIYYKGVLLNVHHIDTILRHFTDYTEKGVTIHYNYIRDMKKFIRKGV